MWSKSSSNKDLFSKDGDTKWTFDFAPPAIAIENFISSTGVKPNKIILLPFTAPWNLGKNFNLNTVISYAWSTRDEMGNWLPD